MFRYRLRAMPQRSHLLLYFFIFLALLGLGNATLLTRAAYRQAEFEASAYQKSKAADLAQRTESFVKVGIQLVSTLKVLIENYPGDKVDEVEKMILQIHESAPRDMIYGVTASYEPYSFLKQTKYFAPYARWDSSKSKRMISYECSTPAYDYPNQPWYRATVERKGNPYLTEPYSEDGMSFLTLGMSFFNKESSKLRGVVGVDISLPYLQGIVAEANRGLSDSIFLLSPNGHLIAHPLRDQLLKAKGLYPYPVAELMDIKADEILPKDDGYQVLFHNLPSLDWKVVIVSPKSTLYAGYERYRNLVLIFVGLYLLMLWQIYFVLCYFSRFKRRAKEKDDYAQMMASLGEIAGDIAHEINNPLAIIQGLAEKLKIQSERKELCYRELASSVEKLQGSSNRIARIIKHLLYIARDGSRDPFVHVNLEDIIDTVLLIAGSRIRDENVKVKKARVPANVYCYCREVQITQVLLNIINGAVISSRELSDAWLSLGIESSEKELMIVIRASSLEASSAKFSQFFSNKPGLDQAIYNGARSIAISHGGSFDLQRDELGPRFVLTLSRKKPVSSRARRIYRRLANAWVVG